ncbi:GNAT family N-acetyltransferase [Candidatus Woesearchaeota archaeon]|nr:GNAT family N-acetyltransferase [Candidatus Woesearchaeota archaeon]
MIKIREYKKGEYEEFILPLCKKHMKPYFDKHFGGWNDNANKKQFFNILKKGYVYLFEIETKQTNKNILIGYATFIEEKNEENKNKYTLNDIHVKEEFQKQGYGSKMLLFVENKIKELKGTKLKILVFKDNKSIEFYKKHNYKKINFIEKNDTIVLEKELI